MNLIYLLQSKLIKITALTLAFYRVHENKNDELITYNTNDNDNDEKKRIPDLNYIKVTT